MIMYVHKHWKADFFLLRSHKNVGKKLYKNFHEIKVFKVNNFLVTSLIMVYKFELVNISESDTSIVTEYYY